jgi:septum formation protein
VTLILASGSQRRADLLSAAGFDFRAIPADVDETPRPNELPGAYVLRVARSKAERVAEAHSNRDSELVLAADTVVVAGERMMGKPRDAAEARSMLKSLSGTVHDVLTGVVVRNGSRQAEQVVATRVHFLPLSEEEISWYIGTGEPDGKAGAYGIQGRAARFIDWIQGSWSNVVGLPISTVYKLLAEVSGPGDVD